jgi:hypothetical protein
LERSLDGKAWIEVNRLVNRPELNPKEAIAVFAISFS